MVETVEVMALSARLPPTCRPPGSGRIPAGRRTGTLAAPGLPAGPAPDGPEQRPGYLGGIRMPPSSRMTSALR